MLPPRLNSFEGKALKKAQRHQKCRGVDVRTEFYCSESLVRKGLLKVKKGGRSGLRERRKIQSRRIKHHLGGE